MPNSVAKPQAGLPNDPRTALPNRPPSFELTAPALLVVSGAPGSGKTTLCRMAAALARHRSLRVAGLLSLPYRHPQGGRWRRVVDAGTGEWRLLGQFHNPDGGETQTQNAGLPSWATAPVLAWDLDPQAVRWADRRLGQSGAMDPDLLVIDEVGPLELLWGGGWKSAPQVLVRGRYRLAIVAVRPGLASVLIDALAREAQPVPPAAAPEARATAPALTHFVLDVTREDHPAGATFVRRLIEDLGNGDAGATPGYFRSSTPQ